jgi:hypothetical protein
MAMPHINDDDIHPSDNITPQQWCNTAMTHYDSIAEQWYQSKQCYKPPLKLNPQDQQTFTCNSNPDNKNKSYSPQKLNKHDGTIAAQQIPVATVH